LNDQENVENEENSMLQISISESIDDEGDETGRVIGVNSADDYIHRGTAFEQYNSYTYAALVYKQAKSKKNRAKNVFPYHPDHVQFVTHEQVILKKAKIPNILGRMYFPDAESLLDEEKEFACKATLVVFKPWRTIDDLKSENDLSWVESYRRYVADSICDPYLGNPLGEKSGIRPWLEIRRNMSLLRKSKAAAVHDMNKRTQMEELKDNLRIVENDPNPNDNDHVLNDINNDDFIDLPEEQIPDNVAKYIRIGLTSLYEHVKFPVSNDSIQRMEFSLNDTDNWFELMKQSFDPIDHVEDNMELEDDIANHDLENQEFRIALENQEFQRAIAEMKQLLESSDKMNTGDAIAEHLSLGKDQKIALKKIVDHVIEEEKKPLFLFVSGEAGTGKSKVISSIRLFFESSNRSNKYRIAASTGTAAAKLYASTIHSFLNLNLSRNRQQNSNWKNTFSLKLQDLQYLIIDEISMIGAKTFLKIDSMLKIGKNNQAPFGGVSLIVFGDFFQFSPVKDIPIYQPGSDAYLLWTSNFEIVILKENFRQKGDQNLLEILRHWKSGKMRPDDWKVLKSRILGRTEQQPDIHSTPIIVSRNSLRCKINEVFSDHFEGQKKTFDAIDSCNSKNLSAFPLLKKRLLKMQNSDIPLMGELVVFVNMKVMITQNISTRIGLSKGTKGRIVGWNDEVILIKSDLEIPQKFPGLDPNVVPIKRTTCRFKVQDLKISRSQFPIIPAYALTDYRSQGDTYTSAIVDLRVPPNGGWCLYEAVYVMLSRVSTLDGLFILCNFDEKYRKPPGSLIREYERLELLSQTV
jgi:hypothetical protein